MSRLIDKDYFLNFIKAEMKQDRPDDLHISNIIRFLEDLPTAYDIEKVVAKLEENITCSTVVKNGVCRQYTDCFRCLIDRSIDTVRKGGVE